MVVVGRVLLGLVVGCLNARLGVWDGRSQLAWALQLLRDGRITGVAFEGLFDLDLEAAELLRKWITEVYDLPL